MIYIKNTYNKIKDFFFMKRVLKGEEEINRSHYSAILKYSLSSYHTLSKDHYLRNMLAACIKKWRPQFPYQIKGWSDAEKLYNEYFEMDNHIDSIAELRVKYNMKSVYITRFRNNYPIKGEKLFEYYENGHYGSSVELLSVFKLENYSTKGYFDLVDGHRINDENLTMFRYSTEEEIEQYLEDTARKEKIQEQIDIKQKELRELYTKL